MLASTAKSVKEVNDINAKMTGYVSAGNASIEPEAARLRRDREPTWRAGNIANYKGGNAKVDGSKEKSLTGIKRAVSKQARHSSFALGVACKK